MKFLITIIFLMFSFNCFSSGDVDSVLAENVTFSNGVYNSNHVKVIRLRGFSFHAIYTGSNLQGTCDLEVSNNQVNWEKVPNYDFTIQLGGGSDMIDVWGHGYKFARLGCISTNTNIVDMTIIFVGM